MDFSAVVQARYATKLFDGQMLGGDDVNQLLEMVRLTASSFGLQPYHVHIVTAKETKEKLLPVSWNQKQITTCSHLLVFSALKDPVQRVSGYEQLMRNAGIPVENITPFIGMMRDFLSALSKEELLAWAKKQVYLAVGNAINGAKSLGFDSCPMEGFDSDAYKKILDLDDDFVPTVVVPIGYAADAPRDKLRFSNKDLFSYVDEQNTDK